MTVETAVPAKPYRVQDLAQRWGVSPKAIRDALDAGALRGFRLQRMWLIPAEEVAAREAVGQ